MGFGKSSFVEVYPVSQFCITCTVQAGNEENIST